MSAREQIMAIPLFKFIGTSLLVPTNEVVREKAADIAEAREKELLAEKAALIAELRSTPTSCDGDDENQRFLTVSEIEAVLTKYEEKP